MGELKPNQTMMSAGHPQPEGGLVYQIGEVVADTFVIESLLGAGAMGQVFEARDQLLQRKVALKVAWEPAYEAALVNEARAMSLIANACVPVIFALGKHHRATYMAMERIYGATLDAHLARRKVPPLEESYDILQSVTEALVHIHSAGIAHRDVKPSNIMLAPGHRTVMMDFGIVLPEVEVHRQNHTAGTPHYMAPELIRDQIHPGEAHLADVYALGVMAFEMLTGQLPFVGTIDDILMAQLHLPPPELDRLRPGLPAPLVDLVRSLMAKEAHDRPQSAEQVLGRIRSIRTARPATPAARALNVLVVEDEKEIAALLQSFVKEAAPHADVRIVGDGAGALKAVKERMPDLMLLDLHLPGMNGLEVCLFLRSTPGSERCTVVPVSGRAGEQDQRLLRELGVTHFLPKDLTTRDRVMQLVRSMSQRRSGSYRSVP
jgi:serine/threonine-protein kinase